MLDQTKAKLWYFILGNQQQIQQQDQPRPSILQNYLAQGSQELQRQEQTQQQGMMQGYQPPPGSTNQDLTSAELQK